MGPTFNFLTWMESVPWVANYPFFGLLPPPLTLD